MELILRVRALDEHDRDVVADVDPTHTVRELTVAVARELGVASQHASLTSARTGRVLEPTASVAEADLVSGDELVVGPPRALTRTAPLPLSAVTADVLAGPDSGTSTLLLPGSYSIGRHREADITVDDPTVSRRHAEIEVTSEWVVTIRPVDGTENGVTVNDVEIDESVALSPDDVVGMGGTRLAFRAFERAESERLDRLGQIDFHRTPYRPPVITERDTQTVGPIPARPEPRRFQVLSAIAPLGAGLTLFAFSRQPQFLALTLMSPLVMIANAIEDRRSGRRRFRDDLAKFRSDLVGWRAELEALRHRERIERLRAAPDLADLVRRAELRTIDLWARGRSAPDFLRVRLGLGSTRAMYAVELERGGADDLRERAISAIEGVTDVHNVPVTVDLLTDGVLGIHGERALVDGVASSVVVQATCLHSPEDLTVVAAVSDERPLSWLKWLPHARSVASPLSGSHVVSTTAEADAVISRLLEVVGFRNADGRPGGDDRRWPWIFLVLDAALHPDPAEVARLLDAGPDAGISVIWLAKTPADVPRQASRVLAVRRAVGAALVGTLWSTDPDVDDREIEVEQLRPSIADRVARALAPVRDASTASLATSIPRAAPLLDVLGVGKPSPEWVTERWLQPRSYGLPFAVGMGAAGVVELDLVENGPHTLIGGTSGAGKSELLQSMVAAMAVNHPPDRLNFLFVDYKGGASSQVFERLPHTVGYVTNLSAELSLRALTSLRAELNRRMAVMEGRAKDLEEMLDVAPAEAPASLVIVVDEFATLVKEVPEFVAGVIDIAQRGRSLGIHLVLATQRPSGSVNENILANTNLRISLRMLERSESTSVIDSPEAADIPVPLRGRGFVRLGPRQLVAFQSAYASAPLTTGEARQPVSVAPFERPDDSPRPTTSAQTHETVTHLDVVIDAVEAANQRLVLPPPRRPWREVLPDLVTLDQVAADPRAELARQFPGRYVAIGMMDAPELQDQRPALVDLEEGGGWLVFGSGGSGKTTLLRTVAASVVACGSDDDVAVIAFDFASRGLSALRHLAQVVDVATGDDLEAVTRHLQVLETELDRRRHLLADVNAEHLTAYNQDHDPLPRIVILIDGYGGLAAAFADAGSGVLSNTTEMWTERIVRLVADGRQVGMHTIITSDRRNAVPARVHSVVANRLILRHADENAYSEHGISLSRAKGLDLAPGRGLWQADAVVQIASVSPDASARAQGEFISTFAERIGRRPISALHSEALPDRIALSELPTGLAGTHRIPVGRADVTGEPVVADLTWTNLTIAGPPRSGRTTALATCIRGLECCHDVFAVGPAASRLGELGLADAATGRADVVLPVLDRLANVLDMGASPRPRVLVIDDVDTLDDAALAPVWERLAAHDDLRIVAAMETRSMSGFTTNPIMNLLRRSRRLLVLQPEDPAEFVQMTGVKPPLRPGLRMVPGRGVMFADRLPTVVQIADDTAA